MSILVERSGLFDTLQDPGRPGFRAFGVPLGGWFSAAHAELANALVGNDLLSPCLELTLRSGLYRAQCPLRIGVVGPGASVIVASANGDRQCFRDSVAVTIRKGDSFEVSHPHSGLRSYIAVAGGGWRGKVVLGSVSSELRIVEGQVLTANDTPATRFSGDCVRRLEASLIHDQQVRHELSFIASQEYLERRVRLTAMIESPCQWRMTDRSDRVGVRFVGESTSQIASIWPVKADRLSQPVVPGTIQWTGSEMIILGVAGGTMGGYPVIGYLVSADFSSLAQIRPGESVRLRSVTPAAARQVAAIARRQSRRILQLVQLSARTLEGPTLEIDSD